MYYVYMVPVVLPNDYSNTRQVAQSTHRPTQDQLKIASCKIPSQADGSSCTLGRGKGWAQNMLRWNSEDPIYQTSKITKQQGKTGMQTQEMKKREQATVAIQRQSQSQELRLADFIGKPSDAQGRQEEYSIAKGSSSHCFGKTQPCKKFQLGICQRGDSCLYAHSTTEVRHMPKSSRTTSCPKLSCIGTLNVFGKCDNPTCPHAHHHQDVQEVPAVPNTNTCQFHDHGTDVNPDLPIPTSVMAWQMQQEGQTSVMWVDAKSVDASMQHTQGSSDGCSPSSRVDNATLKLSELIEESSASTTPQEIGNGSTPPSSPSGNLLTAPGIRIHWHDVSPEPAPDSVLAGEMQQDPCNAGRSILLSQELQSCLHNEVHEAFMHVKVKSGNASTQHTKSSSHRRRSLPRISNAMLLTLLDVANDPAIVNEFLSTHPNVDRVPQ